THAREVDDGVEAEMFEVGMWTNAGQQEEARRMDRPGAQDQLPGHTDGTQLAVQQKIEAGTAGTGERELDLLGRGQDCQVFGPHHGTQVSTCRAAARAFADVQVHRANALWFGDVHVVEIRHPVGFACLDERVRHWVEVPGALDTDRSARA